ncbi:MAG: hypothetical protein PHP45_10135 [Elusimicrobiales bacterium]|nr:hypothetical protein [Elusimicrobiales bacterium]
MKKPMMLKTVCLSLALLPLFGAMALADDPAIDTAAAPGNFATPTDINLASLFSNVREGTMIAFSPRGMTLATAYAPLIVLHSQAVERSSATFEYASLGVGYCLNVADNKASPLIMLGVRPDNLPALLVNSLRGSLGKWVKKNISFAKLPPMEVGIAGSWYAPDHLWILGATIAVKLGK